MSQFTESDHPRTAGGAPTGGQFATKTKAETGAALTNAQKVACTTLGVLLRHEGDEVWLDPFDFGMDPHDFDHVDFRIEDGRITGGVTAHLDYMDAAREVLGDEADEDDLEEWLNEHGQQIDEFVSKRYGVDVAGSGEWDFVEIELNTAFEPHDSPARVVDRAWNESLARIINETDRGTFNSPYVWGEFRRHLEAQAARA